MSNTFIRPPCSIARSPACPPVHSSIHPSLVRSFIQLAIISPPSFSRPSVHPTSHHQSTRTTARQCAPVRPCPFPSDIRSELQLPVRRTPLTVLPSFRPFVVLPSVRRLSVRISNDMLRRFVVS